MITFNGSTPNTITAIKYNGTNITDLVCNGTNVWCTPPEVSKSHLLSRANGKYNIGVQITNNSKYTMQYYITSATYPQKTGQLLLESGKSGSVVFATATLAPPTVTWNISYLDLTYTAVTNDSGNNVLM